jgi:hypothetical protein
MPIKTRETMMLLDFPFSGKCIYILKEETTSIVVYWSEFLTTDQKVPDSILGSNMGIFP